MRRRAIPGEVQSENIIGSDCMEIKELLPFLVKNQRKIKVHCAIGATVRAEPLSHFSKGNFQEWQEVQNGKNFEREYILSLVFLRKGEWLFAGIYESLSVEEVKPGRFNYNTRLVDYRQDLIGRLTIEFEKDFRASYLVLENHIEEMRLCEIRKLPYEHAPFPGFEKLFVSFGELSQIFKVGSESWKAGLSSVQGIYLVSDRNNGKLYVGAAFGSGGFWGRWAQYIEDGHGGNAGLKKVIQEQGIEYAENFQFSVLEFASFNVDASQIQERESHWKEILMTRQFGYNQN